MVSGNTWWCFGEQRCVVVRGAAWRCVCACLAESVCVCVCSCVCAWRREERGGGGGGCMSVVRGDGWVGGTVGCVFMWEEEVVMDGRSHDPPQKFVPMWVTGPPSRPSKPRCVPMTTASNVNVPRLSEQTQDEVASQKKILMAKSQKPNLCVVTLSVAPPGDAEVPARPG